MAAFAVFLPVFLLRHAPTSRKSVLLVELSPQCSVTFVRFKEPAGMAKTTRRVGVILFQLGGPDTLEAIEPFLFNLFCDPDIIDFPFARIGRRPLAKLISTTRASKVRHHYSVIGGGSPIRRFTELQAQGVAVVVEDVRGWRPLLCRHALLASFYR